MKLLIVDDDIYTREGLAETIPWNLYGIDDVMQAENGKEALHTVSWYLPDLIITDIRMPQKNGIDFCRKRFVWYRTARSFLLPVTCRRSI